MHDAYDFLKALTTVLCVAAVTTVLFHRLRQPVVLGYLIAGLIVGPHVPVPLVADAGITRTLSELGVILLMFSLGLELSVRSLLRVGATAGVAAVVQSSLMIWIGFLTGRLFGWTPLESVFTGAVIAISSTTIIAKAFDEQGIRGRLRELVVGILVVEDLIAIVLIATLTAVASGSGLDAGALARTTGRLAAFLVGLVVVGLITVPRLVRAIARLGRPETTLVASIGICFGVALLAHSAGYSVALGAFIAGSLVAESGVEKEIEALIRPVRDMFAAIFFVSVGMMIDPSLVIRHAAAVGVLTAVVVLGKIAGVSLGAFITGASVRTSVRAGMSLAQIGEFSFIIAGVGLSLGATGDFLYPVAVAVSALTTLLTPWLIRASDRAATWVDHKLPRPLQTFAALYGTWLEKLRGPRRGTSAATIRRLAALLLLDAALLAAIVIGASVSRVAITSWLATRTGVDPAVARAVVAGAALAVSAPFCVGIIRVARRLGVTLAAIALPPRPDGVLDMAAASRRALVVTLQLAAVLLVGGPLIALTQPFLPGLPPVAVVILAVVALGVGFWRSAADLQGHVRAGAQTIVEALAAQLSRTPAHAGASLQQLQDLLHGLGDPVPVKLEVGAYAAGRTLGELNLRASSGATVLAIIRGDGGVLVPTAAERLEVNDVLALAGTKEALETAKELLSAGAASS